MIKEKVVVGDENVDDLEVSSLRIKTPRIINKEDT